MESAVNWIRSHPVESALGGFGVLLLVFLTVNFVSSGDTDPIVPTTQPVAAPVTTASGAPTTTQAPANSDGPEVPPVECSTLVTYGEIDIAMGVELADVQERLLPHEVCRVELPEYQDTWVQIEPGDPSDFGPGTEILGAGGTRVEGVGDAALWFVGERADGLTVGQLSVYEARDIGVLLFRILISRPDADDETRLEGAKGLALAALGRFPGSPSSSEPELEPVEYVIERELSPWVPTSYEENLLSKVAEGEWTLGEGLVATLAMLAGNRAAEEVLGSTELTFPNSAILLLMAQDYVDSGSDDAARAEIAELLEFLAPSPEDLIELGAIETEPTAGFRVVPIALNLQESGYTADEWCLATHGSEAPCSEEVPLEALDQTWPDKYKLYAPVPDTAGAWSPSHVLWAREAMTESADSFEPLREMPLVNVILAANEDDRVTPIEESNACNVILGQSGAGYDEQQFKQLVSFHMATCLMRINTRPITDEDIIGLGEGGDQGPRAPTLVLKDNWWWHGMAFYLSAAVYPEGNLEHEYPTAELEQSEDNHTMENRGAGNWALFEYMHVQRGLEVKSVFETRTGLPSSVSQFFHLFSLTSTNADLRDIGRQVPLVPYTPQYDTVEITGPGTIDDVTPRPWGMRRLLLLVEDDMYACISPDTGGSVEASWRPGSPGERGVNYIEVPEIPIDGDSTLVVTATGTGNFTLTINDVVEDPDDCEKEPEDDGGSEFADACLEICSPSLYYWDLETVITIEEYIGG